MSLVSNNIKYLRKLNGLTQEQFARRIGIKRSLLGAYEEARANPNYNNLVAMAKAFNTTVDILLKQDLQRIRQTPELNLPLQNIGHPTGRDVSSPSFSDPEDSPLTRNRTDSDSGATDRPERSIRPPLIRDPMPPESYTDDPEPASSHGTPKPQPLAAVLEKYYREPSLREPMNNEPAPGATAPGSSVPGKEYQQPPAPRISEPQRRTGSQPRPLLRSVAQRIIPRPISLKDGVTFPHLPPAPARPEVPQPVPTPSPTFNNVYEQSVAARPPREEQATQPAIPLVQQFQFGEYQQRYQQPDYLSRLPTMRLPNLPAGHYRAFEADADFSLPGALLIGQFVRNWFDIADGKLYVLLIQGQGPTCRRIFNQVKTKGTLLLTADKPAVPSREMALKDVLEVWEVKAFVSQQLPEPSPNLDRLRQLADELRYEIDRLK